MKLAKQLLVRECEKFKNKTHFFHFVQLLKDDFFQSKELTSHSATLIEWLNLYLVLTGDCNDETKR